MVLWRRCCGCCGDVKAGLWWCFRGGINVVGVVITSWWCVLMFFVVVMIEVSMVQSYVGVNIGCSRGIGVVMVVL